MAQKRTLWWERPRKEGQETHPQRLRHEVRDWFRSLPDDDKFELGDQLVLGTFERGDWEDLLPPCSRAPGFWRVLDEERITWEIENGVGSF